MTFVLVHGGGFTGACWDDVAPHLAHPAVALDLPGRGSRPADLENLQIRDWVEAAVEDVRKIGGRVVLVGHSLAGVTLPGVAAAIPELLERLVFVSCTVPAEGQCVMDTLDREVRETADANVRQGSSGGMSEAMARERFCNDMDEGTTRRCLAQIVPESMNPILEPVSLAGLRKGIPASYVKLLKDAIVTPEMQDQMIANLGTDDVRELDVAHMAMFSAPEALAKVLNALHG